MESDRYRNFRLRGIPDSFQNRKQVRELVRTALQLDEGAAIAVHSLARNPLEHYSRIATLTFGNSLPAVLKGSRSEWSCAIPDYDEDEAERWGPQRLVFDTHFRGFTPLHRTDDNECTTDLIAISGLAGHAFGSFKARGSSFMWLRDDLPVRLRQTRILVYGYDTKVVASSSFQNLNDLGNMFQYSVKRLQLGSSGCCQIRPTIFLGHSLGGLIIKEAITKMKRSRKVEDEEFLDRILAFMFFGVPHQGMATEHLFPMVGEQPNRSLIQSLSKHSAILQRYEEQFSEALDMKEPPEILSFYETELSPTAKFNEDEQLWESDETRLAVLVDRSSATSGCTSGCAMARNHSEMVKFTSEMDEMYDIVLASLLPLFNTDRMTSKSLSAKQIDCLQSLFFNQQNFRQAEIHDAENTCAWLLHDPRYRHWMHRPRGLLWIKGKPGAGKSVLMKYAAERLRETSSGSKELVASFYIHGRGVDLQKRATGVFRALLHDLLPHFDGILSEITASFEERESRYGSYRDGRWEWAEKELEKLLFQVFTHTSRSRRIVIFIDALDECENDVPIRLLTCLKRFGEKIEQQSFYAKICFSSRHYPILGQAHIPTIVVENKNRDDIRQVTEEKLRDIDSEEERQRIVDAILSKDDGVFQWAVLVTDRAIKKYFKGFSVRGIEREIETLPAELDSLYAGLLDEIDADEIEKAQTIKLFRWILFACRPLSIRELREALAANAYISYATVLELREHGDYAETAERFERRLIDMSKGLIQFNTRDVYESFGPDGSDREVEFIHQSVPDYLLEYFLKPAEAVDDSSLSSLGWGHFELSRCCLRYLTIYEIRDSSKLPRVDILVRYPLAEYATRYLCTHIQQVEAEQVDQSDLVRLFHWDDETRNAMARLWRIFDPQSVFSPAGWPFPDGNTIHVVAAVGSISALEAMLYQDGIEVDPEDSSQNTPLLISLREGHHNIAQELLDRSAKWLYQQGKAERIKALSTLDVNSLPTSAKSYLVNVNAENDDLETPMTMAVSTGAPPEVIFALIEAGASIESFDPASSPLLYSIRTNNKKLLIKLVENGAKLDGAVYYAVARMARMNDEDMTDLVEILLARGANTQALSDVIEYATAEVYSGHEDAADISSGSAFQIAARIKNLSIFQLLLDYSSPTQEELQAALEAISAGYNIPAFELFVAYCPGTLKAKNVVYAVDMDNMPVFELLMDQRENSLEETRVIWKAIVDRNNGPMAEFVLTQWSRTPDELRNAFRRSMTVDSLDTFGVLLTDWSHTPMRVYDALVVTMNRGDLPMVQLFLIHAMISSSEPWIQNVLTIAVALGNECMTETILNTTTEMNRSDSEVYDMFVAAAKSDNVSMVELLVNHRAIATNRQQKDLDVIMLAAMKADDACTARLLLRQRGILSDLGPEKWYYTSQIALHSNSREVIQSALAFAVESGKAYVANLFLMRGAKFDCLPPRQLRHHLIFAVEAGDAYMVESLLRHGADIDATDEEDIIPTTPTFASLLTLNVPTIRSQLYRRTNHNKGKLLSAALLYYALEMHYYAVFRLLLSSMASLDSEQIFPSAPTTNSWNPILVKLLIAKRGSLTGIDVNLRNSLDDARLYGDKYAINYLIRLIATVHYRNTLAWPPEYPTEQHIAELLDSTDVQGSSGVLDEIFDNAVSRGNEELVDFIWNYVGTMSQFVRVNESDSVTQLDSMSEPDSTNESDPLTGELG